MYHHLERDAIAAEIRDAELVLTAVFDQNLPDVAQTIAVALAACRNAGRTKPLNCIACENMMDSSSTLGSHVRRLLRDEDLTWCERYVGFPDCMISRVVPRPEPDPLFVIAENYNEWTVRADVLPRRETGSPQRVGASGQPDGSTRTETVCAQRRPRDLRVRGISTRPRIRS